MTTAISDGTEVHHDVVGEAEAIVRELWRDLAGDPAMLDRLVLEGPAGVLASVFDVTAFATGAIGVATLAVAELAATRRRTAIERAHVESVHAAAAFRSEALFTPHGWALPPVWDPIAGDYRTRDGFLRLHTNYASHREAALRVLGVAAEKARVTDAVAGWEGAALEAAVAAAGGASAFMYDRASWLATAHGAATKDERPIALEPPDAMRTTRRAPPCGEDDAPLVGIRVLDLTRVIAGPIATRFLAAHGADVLRIDPPGPRGVDAGASDRLGAEVVGFEEVPAIVPDVTQGKRCARLDLASAEGASRFEELLAEADVLVLGYRPGALDRHGFAVDAIRARHPHLVVTRHDAYGFAGPLQGRRGFDSLVQMSVGICAEPNLRAGRPLDDASSRPTPLPTQALDHGLGYLLAAAVCRALVLRERDGAVVGVRGALLGVANVLWSSDARRASVATRTPSEERREPRSGPPSAAPSFPDRVFEEVTTAWGPARRVRCPGTIGGRGGTWRTPAGPLGAAAAAFTAR